MVIKKLRLIETEPTETNKTSCEQCVFGDLDSDCPELEGATSIDLACLSHSKRHHWIDMGEK